MGLRRHLRAPLKGSPIPSFPESPFSPEKSLKSSKASKWYTPDQSKTIRIAVPAVMGGSNNVFRD
uniref:Retrotransposon protein, putative, Ty3-gypsy subclass n=1 Tax=Oryza sativa subsp. japonica TaxID=39947 RepID=Q33AU8_ORYSJ|nr:retrotransposon protein, putative, Ty3-gypsy subclass [Oryza sativa Japonica Group]